MVLRSAGIAHGNGGLSFIRGLGNHIERDILTSICYKQ